MVRYEACGQEWEPSGAGTAKPLYIIGTEVPTPGGAQEAEDSVTPTSTEDAKKTISVARETFREKGLSEAWERVIALVVQPGVEFGDDQILTFPNMVYEAHPTDYQTEKGLKNLVGDHYCILKVGPWLTFAYREGIFLLSEIERELFGDEPEKCSRIVEVIEEVMLESPKDWKKYYSGSAEELAYKRKYSFSDRSRYYWPDERIQASVKVLMDNLSASPLPFTRYCTPDIAGTAESP